MLKPKKWWHPWFAWHPVRQSVTGQWLWLRWIERDYVDDWFGGHYEYRLPIKENTDGK